MPTVFFACDDVSFQWQDHSKVIHWLNQVAAFELTEITTLSYVFCSDDKLLEINKEHLDHDFYTDVITFDLSDREEIDGEIYISIDRVSDNAKKLKVSFEEELCQVMAHGLLHLLGYDDKTEEQKKEMRSKESICLSLLPEVPRGTLTI